jgi:UDPglucose--hexose-1-phosphate uridylyltransferase
MAIPVTPRVIKAKLMAAHDYYVLKERCVYCDVLHQELTDRKRLVAENDDFVSLAPFASTLSLRAQRVPEISQQRLQPGQFLTN